MTQILTVDILKNAILTHRAFELDYGRVPGDSVEIVKLVRDALADPLLHVQLYVSPKRPCEEINWRAQTLILDHVMLKTTLDRLQSSFLTINTTYRQGTVNDRPLPGIGDCC